MNRSISKPLFLVFLLLCALEGLGDARHVFEVASPAVVSIRSQSSGTISSGTGFIIEAEGVVVTNLHVIANADRIEIKLKNGEQFDQVRVLSFDEDRDIAILRIPGFGLPIVALGNSDKLVVGERVVAIGNPSGLEHSVTSGIISSIRIDDVGTKLIQTDTAASPGSSGGPLLNSKGEVVGVVTFKVTTGESLNFAIPINYVRGMLAFQTPMTIAELNNSLESSDRHSLFSTTQSQSLTGRWFSLRSSTVRDLRQTDDRLVGSSVTDPPYTYDLERQADGTYSGIARGRQVFGYYSIWLERNVEKECLMELPMELTVVTADRLEGRVMTWPIPKRGGGRLVKFVDSCGQAVRDQWYWMDFVWVKN